MHEFEQSALINSTDRPTSSINESKASKANIFREITPTKAKIYATAASAITLLTATGCNAKQSGVVNCICLSGAAVTFVTTFVLHFAIFPGIADEARERIRLRNRINTGAVDPDDWELQDFAHRLHHDDTAIATAASENYEPGFLTKVLMNLYNDDN
jgi:hypothetical protein